MEPSRPWSTAGVAPLLAMTDYQWLGIGGIVVGLLIIFNCRRIADLFAVLTARRRMS